MPSDGTKSSAFPPLNIFPGAACHLHSVGQGENQLQQPVRTQEKAPTRNLACNKALPETLCLRNINMRNWYHHISHPAFANLKVAVRNFLSIRCLCFRGRDVGEMFVANWGSSCE